MLSFQSPKNSSNAVQIKDHVIRHVSTKNTSDLEVKSYNEKFLPKGIIEKGKIVDEKAFDNIMYDCVKKWKLKNKEIKLFAPDAALFFRKLSIPNEIPEEEVRGYLNFEIGTNIHLPYEDPYFDFHFLSEASDDYREILFFSAPEPMMKQYRNKLEEFKMKPIVAAVSPLSIYHLFSDIGIVDEQEHYLIIEWDLTSINLSIFHQHIPIFIRHLPQVFNEADWQMGRWREVVDLVCLDESKVTRDIMDSLSEIDRVMNFYKYSLHQGEKEITSIIVVGDHPMLPSINEKLKEYNVRLLSLNDRQMLSNIEKLGIHPNYLLPLSLCIKEV